MVPGTHDDADLGAAGTDLGDESVRSVAAAVGAAVLAQDTPPASAADAADEAWRRALGDGAELPSADDRGAPAGSPAPLLPPLVAMLPDVVRRAERNRERFTLVLARPGRPSAPSWRPCCRARSGRDGTCSAREKGTSP